MSQTGRISAALLIAACQAVPSSAQVEDNFIPRASHSIHNASADEHEEYDENGLETDFKIVDAAHAAYLKKKDLQLARPETPAQDQTPLKPPPNWLVNLFDFLGYFAPIFRILFYIAIGAVCVGILYFLFGEALRVRFGNSRKKKNKDGDDILPDYRPEESTARSLLEEADALARAGKFAEAVHLLLFRSIEDIQTRLENGVPRSLTAREIGGLKYLPKRARSAMGPIIAIVEKSFFGGQDVDESGWKKARSSYEEFAFGGEWS